MHFHCCLSQVKFLGSLVIFFTTLLFTFLLSSPNLSVLTHSALKTWNLFCWNPAIKLNLLGVKGHYIQALGKQTLVEAVIQGISLQPSLRGHPTCQDQRAARCSSDHIQHYPGLKKSQEVGVTGHPLSRTEWGFSHWKVYLLESLKPHNGLTKEVRHFQGNLPWQCWMHMLC